MAKLTGWKKWAVQRDLAEGKTQTSIARMYGVTQQSVSDFAVEHREAIEEVKRTIDVAYAGLWAAEKQKRVAVYQDIVEEMGEIPHDAEGRRAQMSALRAIADELGDLPQRIKIEGGKDPVRHVLEGVDTSKLA